MGDGVPIPTADIFVKLNPFISKLPDIGLDRKLASKAAVLK
jgi:hypothetical protein